MPRTEGSGGRCVRGDAPAAGVSSSIPGSVRIPPSGPSGLHAYPCRPSRQNHESLPFRGQAAGDDRPGIRARLGLLGRRAKTGPTGRAHARKCCGANTSDMIEVAPPHFGLDFITSPSAWAEPRCLTAPCAPRPLHFHFGGVTSPSPARPTSPWPASGARPPPPRTRLAAACRGPGPRRRPRAPPGRGSARPRPRRLRAG